MALVSDIKVNYNQKQFDSNLKIVSRKPAWYIQFNLSQFSLNSIKLNESVQVYRLDDAN